MTYLPDSISDILDAPEGAHYEFKEWKRHGDFTQALRYCCALANCGTEKISVASGSHI